MPHNPGIHLNPPSLLLKLLLKFAVFVSQMYLYIVSVLPIKNK